MKQRYVRSTQRLSYRAVTHQHLGLWPRLWYKSGLYSEQLTVLQGQKPFCKSHAYNDAYVRITSRASACLYYLYTQPSSLCSTAEFVVIFEQVICVDPFINSLPLIKQWGWSVMLFTCMDCCCVLGFNPMPCGQLMLYSSVPQQTNTRQQLMSKKAHLKLSDLILHQLAQYT